jgi:hypothetical protein
MTVQAPLTALDGKKKEEKKKCNRPSSTMLLPWSLWFHKQGTTFPLTFDKNPSSSAENAEKIFFSIFFSGKKRRFKPGTRFDA